MAYWSPAESFNHLGIVESPGGWFKLLLSTTVAYQIKADWSLSRVESPLCWGSYVLADLAIPKDKKTSNHFGALGSSPPGPGEGSLQIEQRMMYLWSSNWDIRLVMKHRRGFKMICLVSCWVGHEIIDWESNGRKRNKIAGCFSKEDRSGKCHPLGYGVMKGELLAITSQGFQRASHLH